MKVFTDYPVIQLGDTAGEEAPVREADVISYDRDKYCEIIVEGIALCIKAGYLYTEKGKYGTVPAVSVAELEKLPDTEL